MAGTHSRVRGDALRLRAARVHTLLLLLYLSGDRDAESLQHRLPARR